MPMLSVPGLSSVITGEWKRLNRIGVIITDTDKPKYSQLLQSCFSSTLFTTQPTWTPLGSNPDVRGEKTSTYCLSCTIKFHVTNQLYDTEHHISTLLSRKPVTLIQTLSQRSPVNVAQIFSFVLFILLALTILPYNSKNMHLYLKYIYNVLSQNVPSYMFRFKKTILRKIYIQRNSDRRYAKRTILKTMCRITVI
jgi:hypothetical protein